MSRSQLTGIGGDAAGLNSTSQLTAKEKPRNGQNERESPLQCNFHENQ